MWQPGIFSNGQLVPRNSISELLATMFGSQRFRIKNLSIESIVNAMTSQAVQNALNDDKNIIIPQTPIPSLPAGFYLGLNRNNQKTVIPHHKNKFRNISASAYVAINLDLPDLGFF